MTPWERSGMTRAAWEAAYTRDLEQDREQLQQMADEWSVCDADGLNTVPPGYWELLQAVIATMPEAVEEDGEDLEADV